MVASSPQTCAANNFANDILVSIVPKYMNLATFSMIYVVILSYIMLVRYKHIPKFLLHLLLDQPPHPNVFLLYYVQFLL